MKLTKLYPKGIFFICFLIMLFSTTPALAQADVINLPSILFDELDVKIKSGPDQTSITAFILLEPQTDGIDPTKDGVTITFQTRVQDVTQNKAIWSTVLEIRSNSWIIHKMGYATVLGTVTVTVFDADGQEVISYEVDNAALNGTLKPDAINQDEWRLSFKTDGNFLGIPIAANAIIINIGNDGGVASLEKAFTHYYGGGSHIGQ